MLTVSLFDGIIYVTISLPPQLFTVWGQNRDRGWKKVALEMFPVIAGLKPAIDAFRVASGAKIEEGQKYEPLQEMVRDDYYYYYLSQRQRLI